MTEKVTKAELGNIKNNTSDPIQFNGEVKMTGAVEMTDDVKFTGDVEFTGNVTVGIDSLLQVAAVPVTFSVSSGSRSGTATISAATLSSSVPTGFTPIGVVGVSAHSDYWYPYRYYLNSDGELVLSLARYTGTVSSTTTLNNTVYVLCLRATT